MSEKGPHCPQRQRHPERRHRVATDAATEALHIVVVVAVTTKWGHGGGVAAAPSSSSSPPTMQLT